MENKLIVMNVGNIPKSLDPLKLAYIEHFLILQSVSQTLVKTDESGRIIGDLATKWEISKDGTEYEFSIFDDAYFHNCKKVTSDDVIESLNGHFQENSVVAGHLIGIIKGSSHIQKGMVPKGLKKINDKNFKIILEKPYPPLLYILGMPGFAIYTKNDLTFSGPMIPSYNSKLNQWKLIRNIKFKGKASLMDEITINERPNFKENLELFNKGDLDLSLGVNISDLEKFSATEDISIIKTESLAINHFYYNCSYEIFKNKDFRKELGILIQNIAQDSISEDGFLVYNPFFLPKGILPHEYYQIKSTRIALADFSRKWKNHYRDEKVKIVLKNTLYTNKFINKLNTVLSSVGLKVDVILSNPVDFLTHMRSQDYHIIGGAYIGNFPDPDGFLDIINQSSKLHYGKFSSKKFFSEIGKIKFSEVKDERLYNYVEKIKNLENEWYFIPLFQLKMPILHHKRLHIPETNFKYESELWRIFWERN